MKERMAREAAILAKIDDRREVEGPGVGSAIERRVIGAHLAELEAGIADELAARLRALDPIWQRL
jgi:hypothetical protein